MAKTIEHIDAALADTKQFPAIAATNIAARPSSRPLAISAITSPAFPRSMQPSRCPESPGACASIRGSIWEPLAGYSRAVRVGDRILVSGTTATHGAGEVIAPGNPASQTVYILDKIRASIEALGGTMEDVVRTRVYLKDKTRWEEVSRVHGRVLGHVRPANTLLEVSGSDRQLRCGDRSRGRSGMTLSAT